MGVIPRRGTELVELVQRQEGLSLLRAGQYSVGMYTLEKEEHVRSTRERLVSRWGRGIDRGMLREYKVMYYVLGKLLSRVGEA